MNESREQNISDLSETQRIVVVSELFYPEESATAHILTKIAGELSTDFKMLVLTGPAHYEERGFHTAKKPPFEERDIVRISSPRLTKNELFGRIARFLLLTIALGWRTLRQSRRPDIVFAVTNPAPLLVVLALIRSIRRFRLVFLVHDVFPENAVAAGIIRSDQLLYSLLKRLFDWAYGSADAVITIGRDMTEVVAKKIPAGVDRITLIENWADYPLMERIPRNKSMISNMGLSDRIVIQYAGNMGRAQGLLEFVEVVSSVRNDDVRFVFRGSGALSTALKEATDGLHSVILEGPYPRSDQRQVLSACDIGLVILGRDMFGLGVPSKTYNILAAGKPVLFLGPKGSEIFKLIESHDIGWAFDWNETDKMSRLIEKWSMRDLQEIEARGRKARALVESAYTEPQQLAKFRELFRSLSRFNK